MSECFQPASVQIRHTNEEAMSAVPTNVGVFFGQVDTCPSGWYWAADTKSETPKGTIQGPFETKAHAIEDAALCVSTDEHSGASS